MSAKEPPPSSGVSKQSLSQEKTFFRAVSLVESGHYIEASECCVTLLTASPNHVEGLGLLGVIAQKMDRHDLAIAQFQKALKIDPTQVDLYAHLGISLYQLGKKELAIEILQTAQTQFPQSEEIQQNLAAMEAGRLPESAQKDLEEQIRQGLEKAIKAHHIGERKEAARWYQKVLQIQPENAQALNNLGTLLHEEGQLAEATNYFQKALYINPDNDNAFCNLGSLLKDQGRLDEAIHSIKKALALNPNSHTAHNALLLSLHCVACDAEQLFHQHRVWGDTQRGQSLLFQQKSERDLEPDRPLRVGFVSGDFQTHSVSYFFESFLMAYDPNKLKVTCYSNAHKVDKVTERLKGLVEGWVQIADLDDQSAAQKIYEDQMDILVDLSGHTAGNRLRVFAKKPAPIQVTWLGYPNTTGLAVMDYRITDAIADPPGQSDRHSVEKLHRLDSGFLCYRPLPDAPPVAPLSMKTSGQPTFVSFNNFAKITPKMVSVWAEILTALPGSTMLIKNHSLSCPTVRKRHLALFSEAGVDTTRLTLLSRTPSTQDHLALYGESDIGLDTFPYNGTTTTCEALWMGVPVIVMRGDRHVSRVGASLLTQIGLESLIAEDWDDYIEKAVALGNDPQRLGGLRHEMRQRMQASTLCNAPLFAAGMEQGFRTMWQRWCRGS